MASDDRLIDRAGLGLFTSWGCQTHPEVFRNAPVSEQSTVPWNMRWARNFLVFLGGCHAGAIPI
ncbi:MAG: hypothetical protein MUF72_00440 [Elainella sp. Prado103]|nr:hypothetical protein [Elainella sp. Prado103]